MVKSGAKRSPCQSFLKILALVAANFVLTGCASIPERNPVPERHVNSAAIQGIPFARVWGDEVSPDYDARVSRSKEQIAKHNPDGSIQGYDILALSGGGANGAFGAGLLVGWTAAGDRPEFNAVTGISTGALIAPFAFLGPEQDSRLEEFYTSTSTEDVITIKSPFRILGSESATSSEPLRKTLLDVFDEEMVAAIAAEYIRGRRLFIGTTNLDAGRPVLWDIGSIAASGHERSAILIADILLASASIPGVFPPVFVEVQVDGKTYDEIHVDGGTSSQVFLFPTAVDTRQLAKEFGVQDNARLFLIQNGFLEPHWTAVDPRLASIAFRSLENLIRNQGIGDLYQIYAAARRDGIDYNLAFIPEHFQVESKEEFDPEYMTQLFDLGFRMARDGYPWKKAPAGFKTPGVEMDQ